MRFNRNYISTGPKLAAFTLIDVLAAIVILSIVISMAFYLMSAASKQSYEYQSTRIELNDFVLMNNDIKRELDKCDIVKEIPYGWVLTSAERQITYKKSGDYLLRESDMIWDTLSHNCSKIEFTYLESNAASQQNIISGIQLVTAIERQEFTSYFYKDYGISESINAELIHEF